jgi:MFS family permease
MMQTRNLRRESPPPPTPQLGETVHKVSDLDLGCALREPLASGYTASTAIVLLSLALVANLAPLMTFPATLPQIAASWGLNASEAGWIGGVYFAGYAVAVPFLSSASDHVDGRRLLTGSALIGAAASLAFGFWADGFIPAVTLRFLGGVAIAGVHMPGLKMLTDRTTGSAQARGSAVYTSCYAAGNGISFLLAGVISARWGWRAAFVVGGIGPLLSILPIWLLTSAPAKQRVPKQPVLEVRPLLRNRELVAYVLAFGGNTWEVFSIRVWFVACLGWTLSLPGNALSLPALGVVAGLAALAGVPASILVAEIATRYGRPQTIVCTCLGSVAVCLALAATSGGPIRVVLPLLMLLQVTSFADVGALAGGTVAAAPPERRGAALALYALIGFAAGFVGPVAVGSVLEVFGGIHTTTGWSAGFLVMALGSVVAAIAVRYGQNGRVAQQP